MIFHHPTEMIFASSQTCRSQSGILLPKKRNFGAFPSSFCAQPPFQSRSRGFLGHFSSRVFQPLHNLTPGIKYRVLMGKNPSQLMAAASGNSRPWESSPWAQEVIPEYPEFPLGSAQPRELPGAGFGLKLTLFGQKTPLGRRQQRVTLCRIGEHWGNIRNAAAKNLGVSKVA